MEWPRRGGSVVSHAEVGPRKMTSVDIQGGGTLRRLFPGFYPASNEERRAAFTTGLVNLDANALLSLDRFTPRARGELLGVMASLRSRLFITHQVAQEFPRNRLSVVYARLKAAAEEASATSKLLDQVADRLRSFSSRYQIDDSQRDPRLEAVVSLDTTLRTELERASSYDLEREASRARRITS